MTDMARVRVKPRVAVVLVACVLIAGLFLAEQQSGARTLGGLAKIHHTSFGSGSQLPVVQASAAPMPASMLKGLPSWVVKWLGGGVGAVMLPGGGTISLPTLPSGTSTGPGSVSIPGGFGGGSITPGTTGGAGILAMANGIAARGVAQVQAAPPSIVCTILISVRARLITQLNSLITRFPQLAGPLQAIEAATVAQINALGVRFNCGVGFPSR